MSSLPIPHLQACAPYSQYLPNSHSNVPPSSVPTTASNAVSAQGTSLDAYSSSNAVKLLSDINFSCPTIRTPPPLGHSTPADVYTLSKVEALQFDSMKTNGSSDKSLSGPNTLQSMFSVSV